MKKIIVIGSPGAGKSVFCRSLQAITKLPLIHLDQIWHRPDRTHISQAEFDDALEQIFTREAWILDGDYSRTLEVRMAQADTIFFLDYPLEICLEGVLQRIGKSREDMPWIEEKPDESFLDWVRAWHAERRPVVYSLLEKYSAGRHVMVFKSRIEAHQYLRSRCMDRAAETSNLE